MIQKNISLLKQLTLKFFTNIKTIKSIFVFKEL